MGEGMVSVQTFLFCFLSGQEPNINNRAAAGNSLVSPKTLSLKNPVSQKLPSVPPPPPPYLQPAPFLTTSRNASFNPNFASNAGLTSSNPSNSHNNSATASSVSSLGSS